MTLHIEVQPHDLPPAQRRALLGALRAIVPEQALLWQPEDTVAYECDGLTAFRQPPLAVVLPETEAQVLQVLRACQHLQVPVVPRGAGTGLSGGALPVRNGVVLSLARFMRILALDPQARTARVQPGVTNLAVSEAAAAHGLYYAPDPSSQIACTVGGNVAENAGGVHCLKYGLTVHNVLGVRLALMDGQVLCIGGTAPDSPGYDLLALAIGSEGMLGVVTEITVRLTPSPPAAQVVMASFDDVRRAGDAVAAIIAAGIIPAGLEMMDRQAVHAAEAFVHAGYDLGAEAILLAESDGTQDEVREEIDRIRAVLEASGATDVRCSRDEAERLRFWAGRKAAFPAIGRLTPDYLCMDGTIPRRHLAEVLASIAQLGERFALRCANVFHAGDGNLHPIIMFDAARPDELERALEFGGCILELCIEAGGTITGEHGVGVEKIRQMCRQFTSAELECFLSIKAAFDPAGLLNPGKAVPTPRRCREFRLAGTGAPA